jgi:pimeloyl-ACP methyl ester carboxylesterase
VLLHAFANSSFYFRHLMPHLADRHRLIAPDLPSFGFTEVPSARRYLYGFRSLTETIHAFVNVLGLRRLAICVFNYGAPVGFNLALAAPQRVAGFVSQNGNAYVDELVEETWRPVRAPWREPTPAVREVLRSRFTLERGHDAYSIACRILRASNQRLIGWTPRFWRSLATSAIQLGFKRWRSIPW